VAAILIRFDQPTKFTVVVDGDVRAHIVKEGPAWRLRRLDLEKAPDYQGVDVTSEIFQHQALVPRIERHLRDT
jgi:hypothetical protein